MMWTNDPATDAERYQQYLSDLEEYETKLECFIDDGTDWRADCEVEDVNTI